MKTSVLFIQGGGDGGHEVDALLATSLQKELGAEYEVRYPQMPRESKPDMETWKTKIAKELESLDGKVILVGHSVGGSALLKYLSEESIEKPIAGLFLLAAPARDQHHWNFDDLRLPPDLAEKLKSIPRIFLYNNRDDEIVPISHLVLHAVKLPGATVHEGDSGGHQFGNDLTNVASDIKTVTHAFRATGK